jgi:alternative ribosome-rescue factor
MYNSYTPLPRLFLPCASCLANVSQRPATTQALDFLPSADHASPACDVQVFCRGNVMAKKAKRGPNKAKSLIAQPLFRSRQETPSKGKGSYRREAFQQNWEASSVLAA